MTDRVTVRPAVAGDIDFIYSMISALAEYERAADQVTGTIEQLTDSLFGGDPSAEVLVAELDGTDVGMALFYRTFSTWECLPGIWLEDLFVLPEYRRRGEAGSPGVGESLLRAVAELTVARGYTRLEWVALNWNAPALAFYAKHDAEVMDEWLIHRLSGDSLLKMGEPRRGGALL